MLYSGYQKNFEPTSKHIIFRQGTCHKIECAWTKLQLIIFQTIADPLMVRVPMGEGVGVGVFLLLWMLEAFTPTSLIFENLILTRVI